MNKKISISQYIPRIPAHHTDSREPLLLLIISGSHLEYEYGTPENFISY